MLKQMIKIINQGVGKLIILVNINYLLFLKDIKERYLSLEDADNEQSNFVTEFMNLDKGRKQLRKSLKVWTNTKNSTRTN